MNFAHEQQNLESVKKVAILKSCWNGMVWAETTSYVTKTTLLCSKHCNYLIMIILVKSSHNTLVGQIDMVGSRFFEQGILA